MDALPGIGHACGHNLIAMAGVGIALALRAALEKHDVPGTVILLGTPGAYSYAAGNSRAASPTRALIF
jgi:metal-dependent amidase/aminoacylase/carboxypeptidase family protein